MKKVLLVSADEVNIRPFELERFLQQRTKEAACQGKVSKKILGQAAKELALHYSDKEMRNIKKLMEAYWDKREKDEY